MCFIRWHWIFHFGFVDRVLPDLNFLLIPYLIQGKKMKPGGRFSWLFNAFFIIATILKSTTAHSHLAEPLPTRQLHCRVGSQQGRDCYGPCPLPDDYGRLNHISAALPAETWARGQTVTVRWHRDNRKFAKTFSVLPFTLTISKSYVALYLFATDRRKY